MTVIDLDELGDETLLGLRKGLMTIPDRDFDEEATDVLDALDSVLEHRGIDPREM